jgi:hypothetical protein
MELRVHTRKHSASMEKPIQSHEVRQFLSQWTDIQLLWRNQYNPTKSNCFSHSGQTFSFYGETNTIPQSQTVSLTVDGHSASMEKPLQSHKVKQFLSQWTDIQLLWRNQYWPTKSDSFSHIEQTFNFNGETSTDL